MSGSKDAMTYAASGVSYEAMDPFKVSCQKRAALTAQNADRLGVLSLESSRGESCYVFKVGDHYFGHVEEGLGTKNVVADAMYVLTGKTYYNHVAQCNVAMVVNDMATLGIFPISFALHIAVGSSKWFEDKQRVYDLVEGTGYACDLAGCVWGGGETPTLKGIIMPDAALLSGSAVGIAKHNLFDGSRIKVGDLIILFDSSSIHANGLTLARSIADKLPEGYLTKLSDGRTYGESLLEPTHIYCDFVEACLAHGIDIHYAVNITGHGWRKIMRAPQPHAYVINYLPEQQPIFNFIQKHGPVTDEEAYGNLNMGAGFAIFIAREHVQKFWKMYESPTSRPRFRSIIAGRVEASETKKVVIKPKGIVFEAEALAVR
jgi:phosphoribosylformylglycinamidine cyclo-ligase